MDVDKVPDYDPPTTNTNLATAATEVGVGVALVSLSTPLHVVLGSALIAAGVFLFGWTLTHTSATGNNYQLTRLAEYDPGTARLLVLWALLHLGVGATLLVRGETVHQALGGLLVAWAAFLVAWRLFYRRAARQAPAP